MIWQDNQIDRTLTTPAKVSASGISIDPYSSSFSLFGSFYFSGNVEIAYMDLLWAHDSGGSHSLTIMIHKPSGGVFAETTDRAIDRLYYESPINDGQAHTAGLVWDLPNTTMTLWVDGVARHSKQPANTIPQVNGCYFAVGRNAGIERGAWSRMLIDESLTEDQILDLHNILLSGVKKDGA